MVAQEVKTFVLTVLNVEQQFCLTFKFCILSVYLEKLSEIAPEFQRLKNFVSKRFTVF